MTDPCDRVIVCPLLKMQAAVIGHFGIVEDFLFDALAPSAIDQYPAEQLPECCAAESVIGIVKPPATVVGWCVLCTPPECSCGIFQANQMGFIHAIKCITAGIIIMRA